MTITKNKDNHKLFLSLEGRLDTSTSPALEKIIKEELEGIEDLQLDFGKLSYLSSAGLRVILAAQKQMNRQGRMVIQNVNETIMEVFEVTGFVDILTIQ